MERQCVFDRWSSTLCGLALAVVGFGASACHDDGPPAASEGSLQTAVQPLGTNCVEFQGIVHCGLGAARLNPSPDGATLDIRGMSSPEKDGVSVVLPAVTSYAPSGRVDGTADNAAMFVRALSDGKTIGTFSLQRTPAGYIVGAAFTGDNNGTYNVNLFNGDVQVGQLAARPSGGTGVLLPYYYPWWNWWWWWWWPHFWNIQRGPNAGGCVWALPLAKGDEIQVVDDTGKPVVADRVELEEVVNKAGSYPYMSFDRIDYTTGGSRMLLESEDLENTH